MVEFHRKVWLFCICRKKVSSHPGNTRAAMWFTQERFSVRHPLHLRRRSFETFSRSFMDKHVLFHLSAQFWALHHPQHNATRSPMTIQHSPWVRDDSRLLWASCLQCRFGVCCFWAWVCVCGNKRLLGISQVALTFISSTHWELMLSRHTHTHVLTQMSSTMTT